MLYPNCVHDPSTATVTVNTSTQVTSCHFPTVFSFWKYAASCNVNVMLWQYQMLTCNHADSNLASNPGSISLNDVMVLENIKLSKVWLSGTKATLTSSLTNQVIWATEMDPNYIPGTTGVLCLHAGWANQTNRQSNILQPVRAPPTSTLGQLADSRTVTKPYLWSVRFCRANLASKVSSIQKIVTLRHSYLRRRVRHVT